MTTTRTTNCLDCNTKLTRSNRGNGNDDICTRCYEYAGWENTHSDENHFPDNFQDDCMVCQGLGIEPAELAEQIAARMKMTNTSHAACYAAKAHDKTKAGRAGCRKFRSVE